MLQQALDAEVDEYLGRGWYQRTGLFRGYRNGHMPERAVGTGMGAVDVRMPRVSDRPEGVEPFRSEIVDRYQRQSKTQQRSSPGCTSKGCRRGLRARIPRPGWTNRRAVTAEHPAAARGMGDGVPHLA